MTPIDSKMVEWNTLKVKIDSKRDGEMECIELKLKRLVFDKVFRMGVMMDFERSGLFDFMIILSLLKNNESLWI